MTLSFLISLEMFTHISLAVGFTILDTLQLVVLRLVVDNVVATDWRNDRELEEGPVI